MREVDDLSGEIVRMQCQNCQRHVFAMLERTDNSAVAPKPLGRNTYARHFAICPECQYAAFDHWNWNNAG